MANKTAAMLLPGQRGLPAFPPSSTVVQQQAEQHQLGSMTVNFKMSVVTSGPHDGLFITTGIQTNNSNSGANGGTAPGNAWWRSMDQLALQQARDQPALTPAPAAGMLPIESLETVLGEGAAKSVEQSPFPAVEESRSRAMDLMYSRSVPGTEDLYKAASIIEEYLKTTTAVPSASPQPAPLPRQRSTLINGGEKSPRHYSPNTRSGGLTLTEDNGSYPWQDEGSREGNGAGRKDYGERSIPVKLDAPRQEFAIKLNTFNDSGNADISGDSRQVVELKLNPADEYLLNDTTTTTTTLEVFRAGSDHSHSNPVDYYKLPPDPFSQGFEPRYVKADGPSYEMSTRTETRFSDRARNSADASFTSPIQQYNPANTPISEAIRWGQPDAGASRPQWGDQGRSESRPISSTSPLSSNWNVEQQSVTSAPTTTILRRQRNEHWDRRVVSRQGEGFEGTERTCPPVPPKPLAYHQLRRGVSQPELPTHYRGVSGARMVPPRPTTRKPHLRVPPSHSHRSRSAGGERQAGEAELRSTSGQPPSYLQPEQLRRYLESAPDARRGRAERPRSAIAYYPPPMAEVQGMGARSASVNEIFKLYQTRDCLGRVVQQLRLRAFLLSRQSEEKEGLSPLFRLTPTTVHEGDYGEEEEDESVYGISLDELLFSLKELDIYGNEDTMTSTSSSSFISDLSPRAEWTRSLFMEPLEGENIGIGLSSRNIDKREAPTSTTTTADAISIDELKGLIARHTPLLDNPISPHLLRLPQLERTLSTLDELSSEEREDAGSVAPSSTASESTTKELMAIDSRHGIVVAETIFPASIIAGDGGEKLTHSINELACRVEELEPRDLLSEIFPPFAHSRPNVDESKAGEGNPSLLPPLPKRPAPPSSQRTRAGRSRPAPLACSKSEEDGILKFENLESEPRRAGIAALRESGTTARVTNTDSPNSTQPKFHLVADGFRLRIVKD